MNEQAGKAVFGTANYRRHSGSYLFGGHVAERGAKMTFYYFSILIT